MSTTFSYEFTGKFGYRLPLYFPFTKSYWGFGGDGARNSNSKYKHSNKGFCYLYYYLFLDNLGYLSVVNISKFLS